MYLFSKLLTVSLEIYSNKYILVIAASDFQTPLFHMCPRIESQPPKINEAQRTSPWFSVFEMEDFSLRSRGAAAILRRDGKSWSQDEMNADLLCEGSFEK